MAASDNYETAWCFFIDNSHHPIKYRNIKTRDNFIRFVQSTWPAVHYINWYNKKTKAYQGRTWLQ